MLNAVPIATALLGDFKSLGAVLGGSDFRLKRVACDDRAVSAIKRFNETMRFALRCEVVDRPALQNMPALVDYLRQDLAYEKIEYLRVLFLNARLRLISDDIMSIGTVDSTKLPQREVLARAFELGASSLIIVHNHPSGDPTPSQGDITLTRWLNNACNHVDLILEDHLIIGSAGHVSLKARGLI